MGKHVISDLWQMQSLPLKAKIQMTKYRIRQWVEYYGEDGVYVSFSGGKDSTVLLDLVRQMYPNVTAVFVDTGLEYPEIREFVKTFGNVVWLKPKKNFKQVITEFGYPFISKEVSGKIYEARNKPDGYAATQCFSPDSDYEFTEDSEIFDKDRPLLQTTGCSRTGCMFCGYGCHLEKSPTRFEQMKKTHPKQYAYIMKPIEEGGLGYKDVIDWINQHGNMDIKY
ncbi:phosphoadenosine phosphosulfate reductase domain-containing protein [Coprococcus comes]|uniref:phosphoadenosine phosphosulfate reductase domain-containing protein n=1 Tax=Coprococcus comes TaxID=410072 RepID=UPI001FACD968|nr:phosphoadenosine phosphosulfate reductase family protein [Coprococcus comes]